MTKKTKQSKKEVAPKGWPTSIDRPVELPDEDIDMVQYYRDLYLLNGKELVPKQTVNFTDSTKFVKELVRPTLDKNTIVICTQYCITEKEDIVRTAKNLKVCASPTCKSCTKLTRALKKGFKNKEAPKEIKITMAEARVSPEELEIIDRYFHVIGLYKIENIKVYFTENADDYVRNSIANEGYALAFVNGKFYDVEIRVTDENTLVLHSEVDKKYLLKRIQDEIIFSYDDLDSSVFTKQKENSYVFKNSNGTFTITKIFGEEFNWRIIRTHGRGSEQIFKGIIKEKIDFIKLTEMLELY